ncbi:MAG: metalloregulator ArsR/SmtB family transcription factor [Chloroflexi bacterium]|nr:metalloregulator ArsR/SmtB family transcription factor [Chloroflexota bacterium]MBU1749024.1 metalloregulator ArsR/SmtB family transcription factor [Chloroflexota bacterium]MBU1878561.1 metalloregulator ArsR/SmtB family transcription factor [Chloroflexota bacterium]
MSPSERCEETIIHEDHVRAAQERLVDGLTATHLAELFKALGDPTRVRILSALRGAAAELCVCDIAATLGMSQSAVSHQLRLLRTLRLVRHRKDGRMVYYALDDEHVERLLAEGLDHVGHG